MTDEEFQAEIKSLRRKFFRNKEIYKVEEYFLKKKLEAAAEKIANLQIEVKALREEKEEREKLIADIASKLSDDDFDELIVSDPLFVELCKFLADSEELSDAIQEQEAEVVSEEGASRLVQEVEEEVRDKD